MVSIILPVYNVEPYLDVCLQSIATQTLLAWECICVNDGSTDGSLEILERWSENDHRFSVYSQHNQGPSVARNFGISVANGDFLSFVDADDVLRPNYLENLVRMIDQENLDIAGCAYELSDTHKVKKYQFAVDQVLSFPELMASNQNLQQSNDLCFAWRYMIRRQLILDKGIRFDERCSIGEDTIFITNVFAHSQRILLTNDALYLYRINESSIMRLQKYNPRMEESFLRMYDAKIKQIQEYNIDRYSDYSSGLAVAALTQYIPKLMSNRRLHGEAKQEYIPTVLNLPLSQHAFHRIGFRNIYSSWREYMVYLAMKFKIMPILKRYF